MSFPKGKAYITSSRVSSLVQAGEKHAICSHYIFIVMPPIVDSVNQCTIFPTAALSCPLLVPTAAISISMTSSARSRRR